MGKLPGYSQHYNHLAIFSKQLVDKLAEHYPSPRQRHHVPMWIYRESEQTALWPLVDTFLSRVPGVVR